MNRKALKEIRLKLLEMAQVATVNGQLPEFVAALSETVSVCMVVLAPEAREKILQALARQTEIDSAKFQAHVAIEEAQEKCKLQ